MQTGPDVLRATDWTRTFHAHGSGADAPEHLALLLTGDLGERKRALDYLHGAILHQGTVYPATVPAVLFVAGILDRPETGDLVRDSVSEAVGTVPVPLRQTLLGFLAETVRSALVHTPPDPSTPSEEDLERAHAALAAGDEEGETWCEPVMEALMRQTLVDLRATAPVLYGAIRPFLTCADAQTRIRAVEAAAAIARLGELDLDLSGAADMAESRDEGAVIVLALGECGRDTSEFLLHADPAIRACAALAPSQSGNPAATEQLLAALAEPAEADSWFTTRPAFFTGPVRVALVRALTERSNAGDARRLLPVLRALAPLASPFVADQDSGPLLALAFSTHDAPRGPRAPALTSRDLTDLQRDYLRVLADSDGYWHDTIANFRLCLARLGLPREREGIRALLDV